jgi:hypothetical protein
MLMELDIEMLVEPLAAVKFTGLQHVRWQLTIESYTNFPHLGKGV